VSRSTSPSRNEFARSVARNAARASPPQRLIASSTSVSKSGAELSASVDSSFGAFTAEFRRLRHENKKRTLSQWSVGRKKANWPLPQSIEAGRILIKAVSRNPAAAALASARERQSLRLLRGNAAGAGSRHARRDPPCRRQQEMAGAAGAEPSYPPHQKATEVKVIINPMGVHSTPVLQRMSRMRCHAFSRYCARGLPPGRSR
jgi:hypothetical protein